MKDDRYHFIVVGAGAAGLSLLIHLIDTGRFKNKRILLIDKAPKSENDRTWCFWEDTPGLFEPIVYKKWEQLWFHGNDNSSHLHDIRPYQYKMIRGIDFYNYCFEIIGRQENISVEYGVVSDIKTDHDTASLSIDNRTVLADYIFSSVNPGINIEKDGRHFLWQHFTGWFIKTTSPVFNAAEATLMDFRVDQRRDTRFVYVMPFSDREALVEYTGFSKARLNDHEYRDSLSEYCRSVLNLENGDYTIVSSEFGMIPMTDIDFPQSDGRIFFIGTAGGQTKASSGYTFRNIQKHSAAIVHSLMASDHPSVTSSSKKFRFYDSLLLQVLSENDSQGATIFTKLFNHSPMPAVLKFLDNDTSIAEDIKLISTLPKTKFLKAAFSHLLK